MCEMCGKKEKARSAAGPLPSPPFSLPLPPYFYGDWAAGGVCGSFAAIFAAPRLNDISSSRLILSPVLFDLNFLQQ